MNWKNKKQKEKQNYIVYIGRMATHSARVHIDINTVQFSWFSHQLISIYTEVSLRLHQQYDRVTGNRKTEDTNLKFQNVARA